MPVEGDTVGAVTGTAALVGVVVGAEVEAVLGFFVGTAVGAKVAHTFEPQRPTRQSPSSTQARPIAQPWHELPPQSTSVSSPFKMPSRHSMDVEMAVGVIEGTAVGALVGDSVGESVGDPVGLLVGRSWSGILRASALDFHLVQV